LGIVTHIFNTILTTSIWLEDQENNAHCQKKSEPSNMSDYSLISVLPALSKAIEIIMKRQINAFKWTRVFSVTTHLVFVLITALRRLC
jgi:hypothetical protein